MFRKLYFMFIALIFCLFINNVVAQDQSIQRSFKLSALAQSYYEGFQKNVGGNEFSYQSLRDDVTASLLTRCTDGNMAIEWETAVLPKDSIKDGAGFVWLAATDHTTEGKKFSVYINDQLRFTYISSGQQEKAFVNAAGGKLGFTTVSTDQHGDLHGYMWAWFPKSWLIPGKAQTIKIIGEAAGSNSWIIVYQARDALSYLRNTARYSTWADFMIVAGKKEYRIVMYAPLSKAGEHIIVESGKSKQKYILVAGNENSIVSFTLPVSVKGKSVVIKDATGKIFTQSEFGKIESQTIMIPKSLLSIDCSVQEEKILIKTLRTYKPSTIDSLASLAQSPAAKGKIYLMNSSHQDIAWMDSPEKCVIMRDTMLLTPLFEIGSRNPEYRFDVEDALMIKEYITRHPDKREMVQQMLNNGNISCGSSFTQPYEELHSGEALARQFYFGTRWLKKEFKYNADTYWNVDVPGRTLQMPQIMRKAGTKNLMLSRQEKGLSHWYSPDGSFITAYSPGHYGDAYVQLNKTFYDASLFIAQQALYFYKYCTPQTINRVTPILSDWDMSAAKDYSHFISQWESINKLEINDNQVINAKLPDFEIVTAPDFFAAIEKENMNIPKTKGERPALWLYIHGPTHLKAITASREADILLPMAEKFATANALVKGNFDAYPYDRLNNAWEAKLFPDHGWGGKNGEITDALFKEKYQFARSEARAVLDQALNELASSVVTVQGKGIPVVVFNSLSWTRSGIITVDFKSTSNELYATDNSGNVYITEQNTPGKLSFFAKNIPPCGYKTFYITTQSDSIIVSALNPELQQDPLVYENNFYKIIFANGGIKSIYDKELNTELLETEKFLGGEVFTMRSEGTGAGEFADIQLPTMEGFDKTSLHDAKWKQLETSLLYDKYSFRSKIRNAVIEETVTIYRAEKRIDFNIALLNWDGEIYREFRMALPLAMADAQVSYEVPFGIVNVGIDEMEGTPGERHKTLSKDVHPRGILNWMSASDGKVGVTMSSSVAVADWVDPTNNPVKYVILQPLLLAARRSCHGEGNEYLQTGDHYFSFSINSHKPGWENGYKKALEANEELQAVLNSSMYSNATLPAELSFFSTNKHNLIISTVKKAEDENGFIVRVYDICGKDTEAKISTFKSFNKAWKTDLLEYPSQEINATKTDAEIFVGHHAIETFLFKK